MESKRDSEAPAINGYVFIPGKEDVTSGRCLIRYCGVMNEYTFGNNNSKLGGWEAAAFVSDNIKRSVDTKCNEVFLERKKKSQNSHIIWKFDFSSTGLVLDELSIKMNVEERGSGQVTVNLSGDPGYKWVPYYSTGSYGNIKGLSGTKSLRITVNLLGETHPQVTRILNQKRNGQLRDYAFEIQIRLKRPDFMIGRSLILLGLLCTSNNTLRERKRFNPMRKNSSGPSDIALCIHIFKGKRLPCRKNGIYPRPKVKCTLYSGKSICKIKTKAPSKTLNPQWNEYLTIPHHSIDVLKSSSLQLNVTNAKIFISRSSEILGHVSLQEDPDIASSFQGKHQQRQRLYSIKHDGNCTESNELDKSHNSKKCCNINGDAIDATYVQKDDDNIHVIQSNRKVSTAAGVTIDIQEDCDIAMGGYNDSRKPDINHQVYTYSNTIPDKCPAILKSINTYRIDDDIHYNYARKFSESRKNDNFYSDRLHLDNKLSSIDSKQVEQFRSDTQLSKYNGSSSNGKDVPCLINRRIDTLNESNEIDDDDKYASLRTLTRYPISVVNSMRQFTNNHLSPLTKKKSYSTTAIDRSGNELNPSSPIPRLKTNFYRSGSVANMLEDDYFEEQARILSHKHWTEAFQHPGNWVYCWHPLLGVDNLMKN